MSRRQAGEIGRNVSQGELSEVTGYSVPSLWKFDKEGLPSLPTKRKRGVKRLYNTASVFQWFLLREREKESEKRRSQTWLAQFIGVRYQTISNLVAKGLPVLSRGKRGKAPEFDARAAISWVLSNCRHCADTGRGHRRVLQFNPKKSTRTANLTQLAEIFGVWRSVVISWEAAGMPILKKGDHRRGGEYDLPAVIRWYVQREIKKAVAADRRSR